jgi:hypothetical protein
MTYVWNNRRMSLNGGHDATFNTDPALSAVIEAISSATPLGKICRVITEPELF